jgi:sigma-B regulation protein RsbU (phosphoserine phosphatase)
MPRIQIKCPEGADRLIRLDQSVVVIGRSAEADVTLDDNRSSRLHAEIRKLGEAFHLRDLDSRNGTYVNGERVKGSRVLQPGDQITIGETIVTFDPNHATAVAMVANHDSIRNVQASASGPTVGDEGTLLGFRLDRTTESLRRDPLTRLKVIYHYADRMRRCFDVGALLQAMLDGLFEVLGPDRAAILLRNSKTGALESAASRTKAEGPGGASAARSIPISSSIVARAVANRAPVIVRDALADKHFPPSQSMISSGIGTAVCVPLVSGDDLAGVVYLDFLHGSHLLEESDLELLVGLANQSAMAVGNALHHMEEVERRELAAQLEVARRVHDRLLGQTSYDGNGIRVRATNRPCTEVGGDFLGVFSTPEGPLLSIADGTGHGVGAALLMGTARAYLLALLEDPRISLEQVLTRLNRLVARDVETGLFVSLVLVKIEPRLRRVCAFNAGHEPPLHFRSSIGQFVDHPPGGMVLGLDSDHSYNSSPPVAFLPGDRLALFTDGIVEQLDPGGEEYGLARLKSAIERTSQMSAEETLASIIQEVDDWRSGRVQGDDFSLMIAHFE